MIEKIKAYFRSMKEKIKAHLRSKIAPDLIKEIADRDAKIHSRDVKIRAQHDRIMSLEDALKNKNEALARVREYCEVINYKKRFSRGVLEAMNDYG